MQAMSATPGELPDGPGWVYEMSWNGPRLLVEIRESGVAVYDAAGADVTDAHPGLTFAADLVDVVLDGFLITPGPGAPVSFVASDVLRLYGVDLRERPYSERRRTLERLAGHRSTLTVSPVFDDAQATDTAARQHGLAGVVAKRVESRYEPGHRTPHWIERRFEREGTRP